VIFEVGKYYRHEAGDAMHILADVETTMWGSCLLAERAILGALVPVSKSEEAVINWEEITEEEWFALFHVEVPEDVSIEDFTVKFVGRI
jgi:hypothetical protein